MPVVRDLITRLIFRVDRRSIMAANRAVNRTRTNVRSLSGAVRQNATDFVFATRRWFLGSLAIAAVGRAVAGSAVQFQQFRVTLGNVTRSTERANEAFAFLTRFAARTPFTVDQVIASFIRLQQTTTAAFRTQPMENFGRILTGLGDLASGVQTDVDNLVLGIQRAVAGRTQRLQQALKTAVTISGDTIQVEFRDRVIEAERSVESLTMALTELGEAEFGGAMRRQMRTAGGMLSNFIDILKLASFTIGEGGMLDAIFAMLQALREWIEQNKQMLRLIGALIGGPFKLLAFVLRGITHTWRIWNALILVFLGYKLAMVFARISRGVAAFAATIGVATTAWKAFWAAVFAPLLILGLLEDFDGFLKGHRSVIGLLVDEWEDADGAMGDIGRTLRMLQGDFDSWTEVIGGLFEGLWTQIKAGFLDMVAFIADMIADVVGGETGAMIRMIGGRAATRAEELRGGMRGEDLTPLVPDSPISEEGMLSILGATGLTGLLTPLAIFRRGPFRRRGVPFLGGSPGSAASLAAEQGRGLFGTAPGQPSGPRATQGGFFRRMFTRGRRARALGQSFSEARRALTLFQETTVPIRGGLGATVPAPPIAQRGPGFGQAAAELDEILRVVDDPGLLQRITRRAGGLFRTIGKIAGPAGIAFMIKDSLDAVEEVVNAVTPSRAQMEAFHHIQRLRGEELASPGFGMAEAFQPQNITISQIIVDARGSIDVQATKRLVSEAFYEVLDTVNEELMAQKRGGGTFGVEGLSGSATGATGG